MTNIKWLGIENVFIYLVIGGCILGGLYWDHSPIGAVSFLLLIFAN
jgi:hypothetical protein